MASNLELNMFNTLLVQSSNQALLVEAYLEAITSSPTLLVLTLRLVGISPFCQRTLLPMTITASHIKDRTMSHPRM